MKPPSDKPIHLLSDDRPLPSLTRRRGTFDHTDINNIEYAFTEIKRGNGVGDNQIMTGIAHLKPVLWRLLPAEANAIRDAWVKNPYTVVNQTLTKMIENEISPRAPSGHGKKRVIDYKAATPPLKGSGHVYSHSGRRLSEDQDRDR